MHFHSDHKEIREIFPRRFGRMPSHSCQAAELYRHYSYGPRAHIAVPYSGDAMLWLFFFLFSYFFVGAVFILLRNSFDMMYEGITEIKSSFDAIANRVDAIYLVYRLEPYYFRT